MKTERRHELQKNELADVLGHELDYLRPYMKTILAVLAAVLAVGITIGVLSGQRASKNAAAWSSFYKVIGESGDNPDKLPKQLESVAKANAGTPAGMWSELAAADFKLQAGIRQMFEDRGEAEQSLDEAKRHFEAVLKASGSQAMLRRRAKLGLAETYEALNDPESAEPIYKELVEENKDDAFGKVAADRLAQVTRLNDTKWYAWFDKYKPASLTDPLSGRDFGGLGKLPGENDLDDPLKASGLIGSELNDLKPESPIEFGPPKTNPDDTKSDEGKSEDSKTEDLKSDEAKPEDQKPDDAKPEDSKPEDSKPEDSKPEE